MIKKICVFIIFISTIFAQDKTIWLLSNQKNIAELDDDISSIFNSEFQKMEENYEKLYNQYLWDKATSKGKNIKFKDPVIVKKFEPTWKEVLDAYGGYSGVSDAGITKNNLSEFAITMMVTSLNFTTYKTVDIQLEISGKEKAIEFYNIENIRREYKGIYSLPNMDAQNLYNYGERVKKNQNELPYLTITIANQYIIRDRSYVYGKEGSDKLINDGNIRIGLDRINTDFSNKLMSSHNIMLQIVEDLISDEYYESLDHRVAAREKVAKIEREKAIAEIKKADAKRRAEAEKAEAKRRAEAEKAEAKRRAEAEKAEAERYAALEKANNEFDKNIYNHTLSMTHSFFLSPSDKREKLIDEYIYILDRISNIKAQSLDDLLSKKKSLYKSSLRNDYERYVINENFLPSEKEYVRYLELRAEYSNGKKFYDQLEFASKVTDDLVMIMISYLNKPKDDRINVINEYLYFIMVQSKNQSPSENERSHRDLRDKSQPFIDECCSAKPYKYTKTNTRHIFKHPNARNGYQAKVAKKDIWENSPYFLTHGFMRFLIADAEYYRKEIGNDKREDAYRELARNFEEINLSVPLYFQLQQQKYNVDAIKDTHRWLKKKFDRYGDKGGSDKGNGLQYLYGAIVEMADVDLENIIKENSDYYNNWYDSSTFSNEEYAKLRLVQMNALYTFYFGID